MLPPIHAFMDYLTLLNPSTAETQCLIERLIVLIDWTRMKFKPKKSRSLVLSKGKVDEDFHFYLHEQPIPSISEEPVKSLGRWYTKNLRDISHVQEIKCQVPSGLERID